MKQKILLFALAGSPLLASAQKATITFKVPGAAGGKFSLVSPQRGEFFVGNFRDYKLDSSGTLVLPNNETVPGVYTLLHNGVGKLYVVPGKSYTVTVTGKKEHPYSFAGYDAEGQQAFNETTARFYQEEGVQWQQADSVFANNKQKALARRDSVAQVFQALHRQGKMDKSFLAAAGKVNNAYHASILGATLIMPILKAVRDPQKPGYNEALLRQLDAQWQELKAISDVNDRRQAVSMEFNDYVNNLQCRIYLKGLAGRRAGLFKPIDDREAAEKQAKAIVLHYFKEPMREYLVANWLGEMMVGSKFYSFIPEEAAAFSKQYPKSGFNARLAQGAREVEDYNNKIAAGFSSQQRFVANYHQLASIDELAAAFKGKTVYMDVWATWCSPCKAAFVHNKELKALLREKGVEALYVSIDKASDSTTWKNMIRYYNLEGYHVRATKALDDDMRRIFAPGGVFSIPRYVILKDGKIVKPAASGPGNLKELERQLAEVL